MNWLTPLIIAVLLLGTAAFDWVEGLYGSCGLHVVFGTMALSVSGLLALGAHL